MKIITNEYGFTYIFALTIVMVMGIMLGMVGQSWKVIKQREQEKELIFRGCQIKEAIERWYNSKKLVPNASQPLSDLKLLVEDSLQQRPVHWLRRLYEDPMTGKADWRIIKNVHQSIIGVASTSDEAPIKINFTDIPSLESLSGKKKYSEWEFVYDPKNDNSKSYNTYHER